MSRCCCSIPLRLLALAAVLFCLAAPSLFGQAIQGAVNITVTDPAGAIIPDAKLELRAIATNDLRTAATAEGVPLLGL